MTSNVPTDFFSPFDESSQRFHNIQGHTSQKKLSRKRTNLETLCQNEIRCNSIRY